MLLNDLWCMIAVVVCKAVVNFLLITDNVYYCKGIMVFKKKAKKSIVFY